MTKDEELAEQFATKECCTTCKNINHFCIEKCECWTFAKKGFLDGLKAGRPKWHKPSEKLPPSGSTVLDENGDKVEHIGYGKWQTYSEYYEKNVEVDAPIAWCETPKYTEE